MLDSPDISEIKDNAPEMFPVNFYKNERLEEAWMFVTERVKRGIDSSAETRKALIKFCSDPVTEDLPNKFVKEMVAVDPVLAKLRDRYDESLGVALEIPSVPEDAFKAGIQRADLEPETKVMVLKRNQFARDVKILTLGAEIVDQGGAAPNAKGDIELPSGIRMHIDTSKAEQVRDLLRSQDWVRRKQLKDRVYEIQAGNRRYILKERKTAAHFSTKKQGHREGLTSEGEYSVAKEFADAPPVEKNNVRLVWEKPIGYVTYPDGFQFAVFEYEEGLVDRVPNFARKMAEEVVKRGPEFEREFEQVKIKVHDGDNLDITFEDYALAKGAKIDLDSLFITRDAVLDKGYEVSDHMDYSLRMPAGERLLLEVIGYDFEYFKKIPQEELAQRSEGKNQVREAFGGLENYLDNYTSGQEAAFLALKLIEDNGS